MSDGLTKYLRLADPLHRGLTLLGVAYGQALNRGLASGLAGGGYVLYRGTTAIDATTAAGAAGRGATTVRPWAWLGQAAATRYVFRVAAVGVGGVESRLETSRLVAVRTDADGVAVLPAPSGPRSLSVAAAAGGCFRLRWAYVPGRVAAAAFNVYSDGGLGTMDWNTPIATVTIKGGRGGNGQYGFLTEAFAQDTEVEFGVRAATAGGVEDGNTRTVTATAVVDGPAATAIVAASWGGDR